MKGLRRFARLRFKICTTLEIDLQCFSHKGNSLFLSFFDALLLAQLKLLFLFLEFLQQVLSLHSQVPCNPTIFLKRLIVTDDLRVLLPEPQRKRDAPSDLDVRTHHNLTVSELVLGHPFVTDWTLVLATSYVNSLIIQRL